MKALLLSAPKRLEVVDIPPPELHDDDVLIRVHACGICGSDVHGYDGASGRRIPPLVMGHEAAGVVERIGNAVNSVQPGDRVTFDSTVSCGACEYCQRGAVNLCEKRQVLGVSCGEYRRHGAFAEWVAVPERIVYPIPDSLSFDEAAMIEAVSVAVHAVRQTRLEPGSTAVVFGSGMIGLLIIQTLRAAKLENIIAVDVDDDRLELAKQMGAAHAINANTVHPPDVVQRVTRGAGADVAFEAVGASDTVRGAIDSVRKGGGVTLVGNITPVVDFPLQAVVTREIRITGSCASAGEYPECIELLANKIIDVAPLISAVAPLEEGPDWFARLERREPGLLKVILKP